MNTILKEILILPGVQGACVINKGQEIQLSNLPGSFTEAMALEVAGSAGRIIEMAEMKGIAPQTISIDYDNLTILVLSIDGTSLLVIPCKPDCNMSLVTTTATMLATELERTLDTLKSTPIIPEPGEPSMEQVSQETTQALEHIKQSLLETVGPVAEMIIDDCIERWTEAGSTDISSISKLLDFISTELDNPELFKEFKEKITDLL